MDALTERQERIVQAFMEGLGPDNNDRKGHTTMTTITQSLPSTNYEHPSDDQMDALAARIRREGDVGGAFGDAEFSRAFVAAGYVFRLADTNRRLAFWQHLENANEFLGSLGFAGISGPAYLAGILAHNDIPVRRANGAYGQLLEVGISPYGPGAPCRNSWKSVLAGSPLTSELPPREPPGVAPAWAPMSRVAAHLIV